MITGKLRQLGLASISIVAALLSACGGSGSSAVPGLAGPTDCVAGSSTAAENCGTVIVALTDAEGDFVSYTVDVLSISLERANGTRVELLPASTRADFAQLTSLSELISTSTVAPGVYVSGQVRLDYSDAEIYLESGSDIVPTDVYDADGQLLTAESGTSVVEVDITLPDNGRLAITRGRTALLSVDFDLAASHIVDLTTSPASAVAQPYLVAEIEPVDEKEIRVRGSLVSVDTAAGTYDIRLRPWYHRSGNFGVFTVDTTDATAYEIDDEAYTGQAGLDAFAESPAGTTVVAFGTLELANRSFTAEIVHAGDSNGGNLHSAVLGNIVARNGDQLVMKAAVAVRRDRRAHFHRTVIVNIGPNTRVSRVGTSSAALNKDDLSVGQRVQVLGEIANPAVDNSDRFGPDIALILDATEGKARMLATRLTGRLITAMPGEIEIQLRAIDRLSASLFDFSGTGGSAALDADPAAYQIATGTLGINDLTVGRAVRAIGFVSAFGEAPPDFEGRTLIGPRDLPATIGVGWNTDGTLAPFSSMSNAGLVIDLTNTDIGSRHHMLTGNEIIDLFNLPASPLIEQSGTPRVYGIWEPGHVELFDELGNFVDELALRLSATDRARSLAAYGRYDINTNTHLANKIVVHMLPAATP